MNSKSAFASGTWDNKGEFGFDDEFKFEPEVEAEEINTYDGWW